MAGFVRNAWPVLEPMTTYIHGRHIDVVCEHLEAVARREIRRLIINVPPGFMKSLLVSVMFPMWIWGPMGQPGARFVGLSHEEKLATRDNTKCRRLAKSEWYQELWGEEVQFSNDQDQKTYFENSKLGYRQVATFDNVTGRRGDFVLIDDPISAKRADSEVERDTVNRWFQESLPSRVNNPKTSCMVLIMQRLHERDPTGFILSQDWGWDHLMLPMRFEADRACTTSLGRADWREKDGELLFPEMFPEEEVAKQEVQLGEYAAAGQLQQRPAPREGGMFKIGNIQVVDSLPPFMRLVRGWDPAGSTRKKSAFTVGLLLGFADGIFYICDVRRARLEIDEAEGMIIRTVHEDSERWGTQVLNSIPQDPGSSGKSQKYHLANRLAGANFKFSPETGKKEDRAIPVASMINSGQFRMLKADWNDPLLEELGMFPGSAYKDQTDALSRAFMEMSLLIRGAEDAIGAPIYVE